MGYNSAETKEHIVVCCQWFGIALDKKRHIARHQVVLVVFTSTDNKQLTRPSMQLDSIEFITFYIYKIRVI